MCCGSLKKDGSGNRYRNGISALAEKSACLKPFRRLLDQRNHIGDALRAVGAQLVFQIERLEYGRYVGIRDFLGRLILNRFQYKRYNALGDCGIAVS